MGHMHANSPRGRLLTDYPTRAFHALFGLCFVGAYLTSDSEHWRLVHATLGYSLIALLGFRLIYGLVGPRPVRWATLWSKLSNSRNWLRSAATMASRKWLNQGLSLAQSWFAFAALVLVIPLAISGHLQFNEIGPDWWLEVLEEVHEWGGNLLGLLAVGHVILIAWMSGIRKQNHAQLMWSGRIQEKGPDLITQPRMPMALALLVLFAMGVVGIWQALA